MDDLDRILGSEEDLEPSSGLSAAVMKSVLEESRTPEPLAFPWRRVLPGMIACLALLVAGIVIAALRGPQPGAVDAAQIVERWLATPTAGTTAWAVAGLILAWLPSGLVLRFARRRA